MSSKGNEILSINKGLLKVGFPKQSNTSQRES